MNNIEKAKKNLEYAAYQLGYEYGRIGIELEKIPLRNDKLREAFKVGYRCARDSTLTKFTRDQNQSGLQALRECLENTVNLLNNT